MTIEVHAIQRVRAFSEVTFGTDASASLASFTDIPVREGTASVELMTDSVDPGQLVQHLDQYRKEVLGKRSAKLTITLNLAATGTAANSTTAAITGALGMLLKASMGGEQKGTGSTAAAGSTATVINVGVGKGVNYAVGSAIGWVNSSGHLETREIKSIATDAVTVKYGFSAAPALGNTLYNCATYYPTQNPTESLQFLVAGAESDDRWLLLGGQLTSMGAPTIDPTGAALPSITLTYEFADYKESDETAASITGSLGFSTYTGYQPMTGHSGELRCSVVGTSTYAATDLVHASAIAFTPKVVFQRVTSPSGINSVKQWRRSRQVPMIEGSWTEPFESLTRFQGRDAATDYAVSHQMGRTAGSTVVLSAPTVQMVNPQRVADAAQHAGQSVSWKGRNDADVGSTTTDLALATFRIHLF